MNLVFKKKSLMGDVAPLATSVDDTLAISEELQLSVTHPFKGIIPMEEYDNLTPMEKLNSIYFLVNPDFLIGWIGYKGTVYALDAFYLGGIGFDFDVGDTITVEYPDTIEDPDDPDNSYTPPPIMNVAHPIIPMLKEDYDAIDPADVSPDAVYLLTSTSEDGVISYMMYYQGEPLTAESSGGVSFVTDDTLELKKGVLSVTTPVRRALREAEFLALDESAQNRGMYFLTDTNDTGSSSTSSNDTYSLEETRIGTWIDKKPLYKKTYEVTDSTVLSLFTRNDALLTATVLKANAEIDRYVKAHGFVIGKSMIAYIPGMALRGSYATTLGFYASHDGSLMILRSGANGQVEGASKLVVTVEYTKTTD